MSTRADPNGDVIVEVTVTNTGDRTGIEVIQAYFTRSRARAAAKINRGTQWAPVMDPLMFDSPEPLRLSRIR